MNRIRRFAVSAAALALIGILAAPVLAVSADHPYERMAPLGQYLIADRQTEVRLAESAAPPAISRHATVLVLTAHGYKTAIAGSNGFTCLVERSWISPFSSTEFWNWKMRGPICYNPAASRSILVYTLRRTDRVIAGETKAIMLTRIRAAVAANALPLPARGAMAYMLSKSGYLGDGADAWMPHLMIYAPQADSANAGASWGADVSGSPIVFDTSHRITPEPETIFMIPVARWSDGSAAPRM